MSYSYLGQQNSVPQDPYDLAMCNPQHRGEADKIIKEIRGYINTISQVQPPIAVVSDNKLKALLQKYRNSNVCPILSVETQMYWYELNDLVEQTKAEAQDAVAVAKEQQRMQQEYDRGGETVMIMGVVSVIIVAMAAAIAGYLLMKKSPE